MRLIEVKCMRVLHAKYQLEHFFYDPISIYGLVLLPRGRLTLKVQRPFCIFSLLFPNPFKD